MRELTVGEMIEELKAHNPNHRLDFSGLDFERLKQRAPDLVQVEFAQEVYRDSQGAWVVRDLQ